MREAVSQSYIDVSNVILDATLIAPYGDLASFFPDSPTDFSEEEAGWSYPNKKWTRRVFGFKLSLASAKDGEPLDADVATANLDDITLGKQATRRLGRLFAPLNIRVEFVPQACACTPVRNHQVLKQVSFPMSSAAALWSSSQ